MPIRPELRHFYTRERWEPVRKRILERANGRCEFCGKPDRVLVETGPCGEWNAGDGWRNQWGYPCMEPLEPIRSVFVILTCAHLNGVSGDDRDENLALLCPRCHLWHDRDQHRRTRFRTLWEKRQNLELELGDRASA